MPTLKPAAELQLEVSEHVDRLRRLCEQLDDALQYAERERGHILDLTARARAVVNLIERKISESS